MGAGTTVVRLNERPAVRPLATARAGALTVEANLFSRFARVLRATFFFYGDAAGAARPALPCASLSSASMALLALRRHVLGCSNEHVCIASCVCQCCAAPNKHGRCFCTVAKGEDPVRMLDTVVDEMQGDLIRMRQTAAQVRRIAQFSLRANAVISWSCTSHLHSAHR